MDAAHLLVVLYDRVPREQHRIIHIRQLALSCLARTTSLAFAREFIFPALGPKTNPTQHGFVHIFCVVLNAAAADLAHRDIGARHVFFFLGGGGRAGLVLVKMISQDWGWLRVLRKCVLEFWVLFFCSTLLC